MASGLADFFHVLNPSALRRAGVDALFLEKKWRCVWIDRTSHPTHIETVVDWALNEGVRDLAIWGGDGTYSRVVNRLAEQDALSRVRIALIPAGTCNDFARRLGLPPWSDLAGTDSEFVDSQVDLGLIECKSHRRYFLNNAGFGRKPQAQGEKRPHPVADIFRLEAAPVAIESTAGEEPRHVEMRALLGIVFNAPYFGGGMHFSPDISPTDNRLDGYFVREQARWKVLWSFLRASGGRPFVNANVECVRGTVIRVRTPSWIYPQADGERAFSSGVQEMIFRVLPNALTLVLPMKK